MCGGGFLPGMMHGFRTPEQLLAVLATAAPAQAGSIPIGSSLPFGLDAPHLHLLTNHIPIFVTFSALVAFGLALLWKNDVARRIALVLLFMGTAGGLLTYWLGEHAYKPVRGLADEMGQDWLDVHMERAEQVIWLFWLAAASALAAVVMNWRKVRFALAAALLAASLGAATLAASGWIADAGGKIRHPEIRGNSVPPVEGGMDEEL